VNLLIVIDYKIKIRKRKENIRHMNPKNALVKDSRTPREAHDISINANTVACVT